MKRRLITIQEQADKLHYGLKNARIVSDEPQPITSRILENATNLFGMRLNPHGVGVPHGVTRAIVHVENIRVQIDDKGPIIRFCETKNYCVDKNTIDHPDDQSYPPLETSTVSLGCKMPGEGYYNGRLRVSVNGSVHVHIETLERAALV